MSQLQLGLQTHSAELIRAWDGLADRLDAVPFVRSGWITAWTRAFAPGRLRLLCAIRNDKLVGLLPLLEGRWTLSSPTNWHTPMFGWLVADEEVARSVGWWLMARGRARIDIAFFDAADPALTVLREAADSRRQRTIMRTILRSPYVDLAGGDWGACRSTLPKKTRKEAERLGRRLAEQGELRLDWSTSASNLDALIEQGFTLEGSGWKEEQQSAILSSATTRGFYTDIARWAHARGELALAFLRLDERPIAFDFCLRSHGVTYVLKGGFDPAFKRFGPGAVLTYESIRRACEEGFSSYELLGADDPHKLSWTQAVRERVRFQAFARSPAGLLNRMAWSHGRNAVRGTLDLLGSVRDRRRGSHA
jgi:CelD/BcsL family acetyltransferase involved in cellulose biosynthesis